MSSRGASGAVGIADGTWACPFDCGQRYKRSSGRSVRRHVNTCFRAHNPSAAALSDEQLSAIISEQQASGQLITGLRRWKVRQPRRLAEDLSDEDRWDCLWGCGKSYRATSSRSIQRHANMCDMRPEGRTGDVDVKALQEQSREQRKKRREEPDGRVDSASGSSSSIEDDADSMSEGNSPPRPPFCQHPRTSISGISSSNMPGAYLNRDINHHHALLDEQNGRWEAGVHGPGMMEEHVEDNALHSHSQPSQTMLSPYSRPPASSHVPLPSQPQFRHSSGVVTLSATSVPDRPSHIISWPPPHASLPSNNPPLPRLSSGSAAFFGVTTSQPPQQQPKPHYRHQPSLLTTTLHDSQSMPPTPAPLPPLPPHIPRSPSSSYAFDGTFYPSSSSSSSSPLPSSLPMYSSSFSSSSPATACSPPSLASVPLAPVDYRSLYEREQQVSDQLRALVASLYRRHGLHHPVFQHRIVSPQLVQQAIHSAAASATNATATDTSSSFAASHPAFCSSTSSASSSSPSAMQRNKLSSAGVDGQEECSVVLSRLLQSSALSSTSASSSYLALSSFSSSSCSSFSTSSPSSSVPSLW